MLPLTRQQITSRYDRAVQNLKAGRLDMAERELTALLSVMPQAPEVHFHLSQIAHKLGRHEKRCEHLARACALRPGEVSFNEGAVEAFTATGDFDAALAAHDRLIAAAPKDLKRRVDKGLTLQFAGDFDAADALFRDLIRKHPKVGSLYRIFLSTARIGEEDPLMTRMQRLASNPTLPDLDRMQICFALAKALESQGRSNEVFAPLHRANALQRAHFPRDATADDAKSTALRKFQDGADLSPAGPDLPIRSVFVTGMPRSGTTLVEQILASHSQVTSGGELPYASRLVMNLFKGPAGLTPLRDAPARLVDDFARGYAQIVRQDTGARSGVVTDKAIQTHHIYGLLHRALRGVRFVVVHRDPRDIALSIYKNHFRNGTHRYSNDLGDIAREIKQFRANVAHWKTLLPDAIHELRYEDLVAEPEPHIRALVAAAELEWEEDCLNFHASKSAVKTLSLQQVRQPIYRASAQAWRKYETELAPFIAAWGDHPWD